MSETARETEPRALARAEVETHRVRRADQFARWTENPFSVPDETRDAIPVDNGCEKGVSQQRSTKILRAAAAIGLLLVASAALAQDQTRSDGPEEEDKRLGERLIRKAATDTDEELMEGIVRLMNLAAQNLEIAFDAGDDTQAVQERIMDRLDEAVKVAASQRRPRRSTRQRSGADKRRMHTGRQHTGKTRDSNHRNAPDPSTSGTTPAAEATSEDQSVRGDLHERRRAWGNLPLRDREEIIQGISDQFLERYRAWIERYYRALQETED